MEEKQYNIGTRASIAVLVALSLLQLVDWADRSILSIALQNIKQSFNLTDAQAGLLPSLLQFGIAILVVPAAMLADRWGRRKIIAVMDLIWSTFTLFTGLGTQLWHLLVARFMVGAGESGYAPAGQTWLGVIFPKAWRSRVFGVFTMFNPIGTALGLMIGGALISATQNWRVPFYVFGIPGFLLAIWVFFLPDYKVPKQQGEAMFSKAYFKGWGDVFKIKSWWCVTVTQLFTLFMFFGISSWVPTLLIRAYGVDTGQVGLTLGLLSFLYIVGPLGGFLADKWLQRNKNGRVIFCLLVGLLIVAVGIVCWLTVGISYYLWLAIYALLAMLLAFAQPVNQSLIHDVVPVGVRATAFGTHTLIAQMLGGGMGPVAIGLLSDRLGGGTHGLQGGLIMASLVALCGVVSLLVMMKYYPSDSSKVSEAVVAE